MCITLQYLKTLLMGNYMQSGSTHVSIPLNFIPLHISDFQIDSWLNRGITSLEDLYDPAFRLLKVPSDCAPPQTCYLKTKCHPFVGAEPHDRNKQQKAPESSIHAQQCFLQNIQYY